jgi:hypothetical protein
MKDLAACLEQINTTSSLTYRLSAIPLRTGKFTQTAVNKAGKESKFMRIMFVPLSAENVVVATRDNGIDPSKMIAGRAYSRKTDIINNETQPDVFDAIVARIQAIKPTIELVDPNDETRGYKPVDLDLYIPGRHYSLNIPAGHTVQRKNETRPRKKIQFFLPQAELEASNIESVQNSFLFNFTRDYYAEGAQTTYTMTDDDKKLILAYGIRLPEVGGGLADKMLNGETIDKDKQNETPNTDI